MYTEQNVIDSFSNNLISSFLRSKLIFCLDEDRDMTDFLIYLIQEHVMMTYNKSELMTNYNEYFIRSFEQIEYKTYLSRNKQDRIKKKLKEFRLIDFDNKCLYQQTRYKVNISEITNLLNDKEDLFREREREHQKKEEDSKKKE